MFKHITLQHSEVRLERVKTVGKQSSFGTMAMFQGMINAWAKAVIRQKT